MDWCSHFSVGAHSRAAGHGSSYVKCPKCTHHHHQHSTSPRSSQHVIPHTKIKLRTTLSKCFSVPSNKIDIRRVDKFCEPEKIVDQHRWWRVRAKSHHAVNELHLSGKINKTIFRNGNILTVGLKKCSSIIITNCFHPVPPCNLFLCKFDGDQ
jgi:hypothetical protein